MKLSIAKLKTFVLPVFLMLSIPLAAEEGMGAENWTFANYGKNACGSVDVKEKIMTIKTSNTKNAFNEADEYSFAFKPQDFAHDDCSRCEIEVTVDSVRKGSAGIMMRSSDRPEASNVHLEATSMGDLFVFFRSKNGGSTSYKRVGYISFPVNIKLTRQGNSFMSHYKDSEGNWVKGPTVFVDLGDKHLAGFYACSGNDNQIGYDVDTYRQTSVAFSDWHITTSDNYIPAEENYVDEEKLAPNVLLRENFADGSLCNAPESVTNPVWDGIRFAELPYDGKGGRYWHKRGDGIYYLGDKKWADYELTVSLSCPVKAANTSEFSVQMRYQNIAMYSKMLKFYSVSLVNGNEIMFCKNKAGGNTVEILAKVKIDPYDDGNIHEMKINVLDKKYEVSWDGRCVINGVDEKDPITYGNIGFKFTDCDINLYRIEVIETEDNINGRLDNYLLDYYDTKIPDYIIEQYIRQ